MSVKVRGVAELNRAMQKYSKEKKGDIFKGLKAALLFVKGEAVKKAPIEFGTLRNSAFTETTKTKNGVKGIVGFTAKYAPYVHEAPMKLKGKKRTSGKGTYWQRGENKFLEKAIKQNVDRFMKIVARFASK